MNKELEELLKSSRASTKAATAPVENKRSWGQLLTSLIVTKDEDPTTQPTEVVEPISLLEFDLTSEDPSQLSFTEIYTQAGVPATSCSIDELAALVQDPKIATQPSAIKAAMVEFALSAKGVVLETPIQDAIEKDKALDAYQLTLHRAAVETERVNEAKIADLTKVVQDFIAEKQAEMDELRKESSKKSQQSLTFTQRRTEEEQRLYNLVAQFLKGQPNPIAVGNPV